MIMERGRVVALVLMSLLLVVCVVPVAAQESTEPRKPKDQSGSAAPSPPATRPATAPATQTSGQAGTEASRKHRDREIAKAKSRMRQDNRRFSKDAVAEAEALYQVANKNWRSDEARAALKTMIEKFPKLNRTGCALLYLGQMSTGQEREDYLKQAIENHSDCFYGNGVQVGGFARYLLAHHYREQGKPDEAERLFNQIRQNYPDAITHRGHLLVAIINQEAKGIKDPAAAATQPVE